MTPVRRPPVASLFGLSGTETVSGVIVFLRAGPDRVLAAMRPT